MMGIQDLRQRFGMPDKAVRRRLDALSTVLTPHISRGVNNAILLSDSGVAIFDRLVQIERESKRGLTPAAEMVANEVLNGAQAVVKPEENGDQTPEVLDILKEQIRELKHDKSYLQEQLDKALNHVGELQAYALPSESNGRRKRSRWQHLKAVVIGR